MTPSLFSIEFSAMLHNAFEDCNRDVMIRFRRDGSIFNLRHLQAKAKMSTMLLCGLLYVDDCTLIAHTSNDAQFIVNNFSRACCRYGFTISIGKIEIQHQLRPGSPPCS